MDANWAYTDTSVLVKRYVREPGSAEAARITSAYRIVTSALTTVEVVSALYAKHRGGTLTERKLATALARYKKERRWWTIVELTSIVLARAEEVIRRTPPARTADALHIASALFFQEAMGTVLVFATGDEKQRVSAEAVGLRVQWV